MQYFILTLHIKIEACVDSFKFVLSWTPILSRLIPRRFKAQCISCTHSLPIFKPHNCWHRITNGTAVECCCSGLNYSLVSWPRDPAWWIYLKTDWKRRNCIFRCLNIIALPYKTSVPAKKPFPHSGRVSTPAYPSLSILSSCSNSRATTGEKCFVRLGTLFMQVNLNWPGCPR